MRHKALYIATIIFFIGVNTTYFWEGDLGVYSMLSFLLPCLYFIILLGCLIAQLFFLGKENANKKPRIVLILFMTTILGLTVVFSGGIIPFSKFESKPLLIAQAEGAANCMTTLTLRANKTFVESTVCFGTSKTTGNYYISGDTIYFSNVSPGRGNSPNYAYGVITQLQSPNAPSESVLIRYESSTDTIGQTLWITQNALNDGEK